MTRARTATRPPQEKPSIRVRGDATATVRVRMLGGFALTVGDRDAGHGWRLKKARSLVKLLALARGHALHRDRVTDVLWPDLDAKRAANNLHRALHSARQAISGLRLRDGLLSLRPDGGLWVDVEAFEGAAVGARRGREPAAYRAAAELYAGELLPEDRGESWTEERREGLRLAYLSLLLEWAALHEERGEYGPAVEVLRRSLAEEPAHEDAHAALIRLFALQGRRGEGLLQYGRLCRVLQREFDAEPGPAARRLYEDVRSGRLPAAASAPHRPAGERDAPGPNNLPFPLTSLVGREGETAEVRRMLPTTRLLTLTGAGGSGKTRLALEVARSLVGAYGAGVWLVELAALQRPELVPRAVAATLGVPEQAGRPLEDALVDHLRRRALLVLDNCEHLTDGAARLAHALLEACPRLKVLATSREPLGVPGETLWTVPPLSVPDGDAEPTVEGLMRCEAVRLFVDRARSRLPAFELNAQNAAATANVCRRLDGLPLAIELACARMGALAVEQVAGRLEDSLGLLTGGARTAAPRQRTMRATLEWSHDLLDEAEKGLFARLSVFAGGWTLEAAGAVSPGADAELGDVVADVLSRLVDKSLVVAEPQPGGGLRYRMLEPIRQYARERLEGSAEEADDVRRLHAHWCFGLAREVEPWLRGAHQDAWLERLEEEYGNLRAALRWAQDRGEADLGLWFGGALAEFWYMSGHLGEARRWLDAALATDGCAPPTSARARALTRAGWLAWEAGDYGRSQALCAEGLAVSRRLGDDAGAAGALTSLGWAALSGDDLVGASAFAGEAEELARRMDDAGGVARALLVAGLAANVVGDHERALAVHEESLALARESGDGVALVLSAVTGALACLGLGDTLRAEALCREGFALAPGPKVANLTAFQLQACAALAASQGRSARAARLWGAAEALREGIGAALSPAELRVYVPYVAAARAGLEGEAWEEAWSEGRTMSAAEAERYALAREEGRRPTWTRRRPAPERPTSPARPGDALTRREREVALLVAEGLTNRRIAAELSVSEHTVAGHVRKVLKKLGLRSRAQVSSAL